MIYTYIEVGQFKKAFGTGGGIKLHVDDVFEEDVLSAEVLFANQKGTYVPYFVENIAHKNAYIVKVEEIDTPESTQELSGKTCYMRKMDINPNKQNQAAVLKDALVGFSVYDNEVLLGPITAIEEYPQQTMAMVAYQDRSLMVPLVEDLILEVDTDNQRIILDLPDAFLDVF